MKVKRELIFYEPYFSDFFEELPQKVKEKVNYVLYLISVSERIPIKFLKHIENTDGLFEVRIEVGGNSYRIFCCFDQNRLVVLFSGFLKKTQKTPRTEIDKALRIMKLYFNYKHNGNERK
jgi:phage-related protein